MEKKIYKSIDDENLEKLHKVELEMLKEVIRICEKHNLNYYLIGGTLLGAVRHKGFIPWDDDLDIAMPRSDYDRFMEIAINEIDDKYFVHCDKTDKNYWLPFMKIRKNKTIFSEELTDGKDVLHNGIFIDIFPMDNASSCYFVNRVKCIIIRCIADDLLVKRKIVELKESRHPKLNVLLNLFSIDFLISVQKWLMKTNKNDNSKYIISWVGAYHVKKELMLRSDVYPLMTIEFEGLKCKAFKNYKKYLTNVYGDYMKLPKEEDRVNHGCTYLSFGEGNNIISRDR